MAIPDSLLFHVDFRNSVSISTIKPVEILLGIVLNLSVSFQRIDIFVVLSLLFLQYGMFLCLFRSSVSLSSVCSFECTDLMYLLLKDISYF